MSDGELATQRRAKGIRRGRRVAVLGMFVLCVAFFLPQARGCGGTGVPYDAVRDEPRAGMFCLPFFGAFAMLIVYGLRALVRNGRFRRGLTHAACFLLFGALFLGNFFVWEGFAPVFTQIVGRNRLLLVSFALVLGAGALGALALWAAAPREARTPACVAVAALVSLASFLYVIGMAAWGLYVSVAACALVAGGAIWEARSAWQRPP